MEPNRPFTFGEDAAQLVRDLTGPTTAAPEAGLRIIIHSTHNSLSMSVADQPHRHDRLFAAHGARIFLSRPAAARLRGRTLRAEITPRRSAFFLER
jgi:Fe-S cluster assembly iron-binding protein IscA